MFARTGQHCWLPQLIRRERPAADCRVQAVLDHICLASTFEPPLFLGREPVIVLLGDLSRGSYCMHKPVSVPGKGSVSGRCEAVNCLKEGPFQRRGCLQAQEKVSCHSVAAKELEVFPKGRTLAADKLHILQYFTAG